MRLYNKYSDAELTDLLKSGDCVAFTEIYNRYRGILYVYANKLMRDKAAAEDVVQEVFIYLWDKRETLAFKTGLSGYLYAAVRYKFFNTLDHKKVVSKHEAYFDRFVEKGEFVTDNQVRENELTRLVEQEVARLPAKMRIIFEMSRNEFLSQREIADHLQISDKTVKKQISYAIKILKLKFGSLFLIVAISIRFILESF